MKAYGASGRWMLDWWRTIVSVSVFALAVIVGLLVKGLR